MLAQAAGQPALLGVASLGMREQRSAQQQQGRAKGIER
jgi:hypothetical protein